MSIVSPKHRRPSWVVAGVVLIGVAALLGAWVFSATASTMRVVVAAHDLEPGTVVGAGDLRVVEMGRTAGLRAVSPAQEGLIVGRAARGPIPAGTVLNSDLFADRDRVIPAGSVVVGAALPPGAIPVDGLAPGDRVNVIGVAKSSGATAETTTATVLTTGTVWSVSAPTSTGGSATWWVSALVPVASQPAVTQAAADGRLRLTLMGASG
jgi:Flp pilus assembly protein CpaB